MPVSHRIPKIETASRRGGQRRADPALVDYETGVRVGMARVQRVFGHPVIKGHEREAAMLLGKGFSADAIIAGLAS